MNMENKLPPNIQQIYDDYLNDTIWLEATHKPTDGLLGFGTRLDADPCHDRFSEHLEKAIAVIAAEKPSSETAFAVLHYIFEAPIKSRDNKLAYWMLQAVHGLADGLICFLSPEDAAEMSLFYSEAYPKHTHLPVQKTIAEHLLTRAGSSAQKKKSLLERIIGAK